VQGENQLQESGLHRGVFLSGALDVLPVVHGSPT
jgi:hypothetical protein